MFLMSYGHDDHDLGFVQINNGKGDAMKNVTADAVEMFRPAVWSVSNLSKCVGHCDTKVGGYNAIPVTIPTNRFPEFFPGFGMEVERKSTHRETLQLAPEGLVLRELF